MKVLLSILVLLTSVSSFAEESVIKNKEHKIEAARVADVVKLKTIKSQHGDLDIQVNIVVEDLGGTTDVSPTQVVYLTLYSKGEMCDVSATFELGRTFGLESASTQNGRYVIVLSDYLNDEVKEEMYLGNTTYEVDATEAIKAIQKVNYCEDFDHPEVKTSIKVKTTQSPNE